MTTYLLKVNKKDNFNIFIVDFEQVVTHKVVFKREHIFIFLHNLIIMMNREKDR